MPSTPSDLLKLELQAAGENNSTWGDKANVLFQRLEESVAGRIVINLSSSDYTLDDTQYVVNSGTTAESHLAIIQCNGTLSSDVSVIVPSRTKQYIFINNTSGAFSITVRTSAGTGPTINRTSPSLLICDATNVILCSDVEVPGLPRLYKSGLEIERNASDVNNNIGIFDGECRSRDDTQDIALTGRVKSVNDPYVTGAAGGLFSGTKAADTWYHCFAIRRDSDGLCDAGFSTDIDASDRPAGFSTYRRIGSFKTDNSANIRHFQQNKNYFGAPEVNLFGGAGSVSFQAINVDVPPGISVKALFSGHINISSAGDGRIYLYNWKDDSNQIPLAWQTITGQTLISQITEIFTSNGQQIRLQILGTSPNGYAIFQYGYYDYFDE